MAVVPARHRSCQGDIWYRCRAEAWQGMRARRVIFFPGVSSVLIYNDGPVPERGIFNRRNVRPVTGDKNGKAFYGPPGADIDEKAPVRFILLE